MKTTIARMNVEKILMESTMDAVMMIAIKIAMKT